MNYPDLNRSWKSAFLFHLCFRSTLNKKAKKKERKKVLLFLPLVFKRTSFKNKKFFLFKVKFISSTKKELFLKVTYQS